MARSAPPTQAIANIPIMGSFQAAYAIVLGNLNHFLRAAALPILLTWLIGLMASLSGGISFGAALVILLASLIPHVLFAVTWYRFVLRGPQEAAPPLFPRWQVSHWRYLGFLFRLLAFQLLMGFVMAIVLASSIINANPEIVGQPIDPATITMEMFSAKDILTGFVLAAISFYISLRWSFAFPATSVDEEYGFVHSWRHSKGQGLRLIGAVLITIIPVAVVLFLVDWMISAAVGGMTVTADGEISAPWAFLLLDLFIKLPLQFLVYALYCTVIANAFRATTGWVPHSSPPPAQHIDIEA